MKTKDLIVVRKCDNEDDEFFITHESNFETVSLCDCYNNYGQKVGCYDAGCYAIENSSSDAKSDCVRDMYEHFGLYSDDDPDSCFDEAVEGGSEFWKSVEQSEIDVFIKKWKKENETHVEADAWTYWDGNNFKTFVLYSDSGMNDVEELDEELQEKILNEYPGFPYIEGVCASEETENFIFTFTRWADDPWICSVVAK